VGRLDLRHLAPGGQGRQAAAHRDRLALPGRRPAVGDEPLRPAVRGQSRLGAARRGRPAAGRGRGGRSGFCTPSGRNRSDFCTPWIRQESPSGI
jgi:hypothetical protein